MTQRKKGQHWLRTAEEYFIGILLLMITGIIFANVVLRYALNTSLSWAEEFARYGVIWITFIGGSVCVYRGLHIAVDLWGEHLSQRINRVWLAGVHALCAATCGAFTWYSSQLVIKAAQTSQKTIALGLPMWLIYSAMTCGGTLMLFRFVMLIWHPLVESNEIPPVVDTPTDRANS